MSTRMLIDARHDEETRVAIVKGSRVEDFDYESAAKRQLKGNIYLARITRVEPSLQAAFVEYGGNRHGFLAFSEIHPDYYQIPAEDREELIKSERAEEKAAADAQLKEDDESGTKAKKPRRTRRTKKSNDDATSDKAAEEDKESDAKDGKEADSTSDEAGQPAKEEKPKRVRRPKKVAKAESSDDGDAPKKAATAESGDDGDEPKKEEKPKAKRVRKPRKVAKSDSDKDADNKDDTVEKSDKKDKKPPKSIAAAIEADVVTKELDGDEAESSDEDTSTNDSPEAEQAEEIEAAESRRNMRALKRRYKIQEVIKRRQVILVQIVKEERGNKGAALTTYISLAGRYCVLMPNSTHSGGISRKISNVTDRKRLKTMMSSLNLPDGMGCIVRTAGMARTKGEVKRDLDYLLRLWNGIRDLTLKSVAPANIYEEGNLIKRSIRDLYSKDIEEILVEGNQGYKVAKDFITMLMPSHAKKVTHYQDGAIPLFNRYQVESQLEAMYNPNVQLKSGGYIVINPTEALISVDVNSGRATKEKNIEETAVKTNLEAAEELGRQLRLRDMAGLIVIDFIDMEDRGNNRSVERRLKDVLKSDRARIQIGRISSFGLLEMSRQRLRPNLLEASMMVCGHCDGSGVVRNVESAGLQALRALEDEGIRGRSAHLIVTLNREVALHMLNKKRADIYSLEMRYNLSIEIIGSRAFGPSEIEVERENIEPTKPAVTADAIMTQSIVMEPIEEIEEPVKEEENQPRTRARRRRRRGHRNDTNGDNTNTTDENSETKDVSADIAGEEDKADKPKSRRRRGRRGGRRRNNTEKLDANGEAQSSEPQSLPSDDSPAPVVADEKAVSTDEAQKPKPRRGRARKVVAEEKNTDEPSVEAKPISRTSKKDVSEKPTEAKVNVAPKEKTSEKIVPEKTAPEKPAKETKTEAVKTEAEPEKPTGPPRKGWWNKNFG